MPDITLKSAFQTVSNGLFQNWGYWILGLIIAAMFYCALFGSLWLFDRHSIMKAPKKKYFFVGASLLVGVFFGLMLIFCGMMTEATKRFHTQIEDMRTAAIGRENRGLLAGIINVGKVVQMPKTNYDASLLTSQGMSSSPQNRTMESGVDLVIVLRIANAGPPTTIWDYKASVILPGNNGKEMDAVIPSILIEKNQTITTIIGPFKATKGNFLLDALSSLPLPTGAANNYWFEIHVNGIPELPIGTHIKISFHDVYGRTTTINHEYIPGQ